MAKKPTIISQEKTPRVCFYGARNAYGDDSMKTLLDDNGVSRDLTEMRKNGMNAKAKIMIPPVAFKKELDLHVEIVHRIAKEVMNERKIKTDHQVGTMIEVPHGAVAANETAEAVRFFSFGNGHGRPDSVHVNFCHKLGLSCVSRSPYRAVAQAALEEQQQAGSMVASKTNVRGGSSVRSADKAGQDAGCNGQ